MKKNKLLNPFALCITLFILQSCAKHLPNEEILENDVAALNNVSNKLTLFANTDEYHKNLLAYKASDHKKAVGWYLGIATGDITAVPDSMDIVNFFGALNAPTPEAKAARVQEIEKMKIEKGTEFLSTLWLNWGAGAPPASTYNDPQALANRVSGMVANVKSWGLDGICISFEDGTMYDMLTMEKFLFELAKYKDDDFYLTIETNKTNLGLTDSAIALVDMIFIQSYFGSEAGANAKVDQFINKGFPKKNLFYAAADFQASYNSTSTVNGPLRLKQTYTNATFAAKVGGFGVYGMQYDKNYKYYREMIQYFNPAYDPNDVDLDGIPNAEDPDDDNDGIPDTDEGVVCTETPVWNNYSSTVSWANKGSLSYAAYHTSVGFYFAGYKDDGSEELTFTITNAIPNAVNTLSFNHASLNPANPTSNAVKLYVDGVQKFSFNTLSKLTGTGNVGAPLTVDHGSKSITFTPTITSAVVKVTWVTANDGKAASDGQFSKFNLNNAVINTDCNGGIDSDGDGKPDHQDTDSNNDGIPDKP